MGLFKDVKKPVLRQGGSGGAEVSAHRPAYVAKTAPCIHSCPSGTDVRGWLVPLAQREAYGRTPAQAFEAAWRTILEHNPFPAVCGRVCQHPCELNCNRKTKDGAVQVNRLERFIGDFAVAEKLRPTLPHPAEAGAAKVAVVGAGPAGLAAAYHLARAGYAVTVFEAAPLPGGMMRYRVPRSVIPAETLEGEIGNILELGVALRTGCVVGRDVSVEQLQKDYRAVFFAMGLQKPAQLELRAAGGAGALIGALPSELPQIPEREPEEGEPRVLNMVSPAIAQGRMAAETIAAFLEKRAPRVDARVAPIRSDRVKLDWYPGLVRAGTDIAMTDAEALGEAARCMSCGMCMDCETCWMYCSKNCFVKLPKGEHYKIKLDLCNGCGKCAESCPCGYIEMN